MGPRLVMLFERASERAAGVGFEPTIEVAPDAGFQDESGRQPPSPCVQGIRRVGALAATAPRLFLGVMRATNARGGTSSSTSTGRYFG